MRNHEFGPVLSFLKSSDLEYRVTCEFLTGFITIFIFIICSLLNISNNVFIKAFSNIFLVAETAILDYLVSKPKFDM